jgi:hypothetical protein
MAPGFSPACFLQLNTLFSAWPHSPDNSTITASRKPFRIFQWGIGG